MNPDKLQKLPGHDLRLGYRLLRNKSANGNKQAKTARVAADQEEQQKRHNFFDSEIENYSENAKLVRFIRKEKSIDAVDDGADHITEEMKELKAALLSNVDGQFFQPKISQDFVRPGVTVTEFENKKNS